MGLFDTRFNILIVIMSVTLSAFAVEITFGIFSGSLALVTDSIHTLMDAVVVLVAIIAARIAMRPASESHTYGYGKIEPLGYVLSGIAMTILAGLFIYEAIHRFQDPLIEPTHSLFGIWGGVYVIGVETFKVFLLRKAIRGFGGDAFKADLQHTFMDIAATTLTIASIPLTIFGFYFMDATVSMILGAFLVAISANIVYKASRELLDVTSPKMVDDIKEIIKSVSDVTRVGPVLLRRSGDTLFADATAIVRGDTSVDKAHEISQQIEDLVKKHMTGSQLKEEYKHGLSESIGDAKVTIRVEPDWTDIPIDSRLLEIVKNIDDVMGASHPSTHKIGNKIHADMRVQVQPDLSLASTYEISNRIESIIKEKLPLIERTTLRLEPHSKLTKHSSEQDADTDKLIRSILDEHREILGTIRIMSLKFGNVYKIDIDCMLDGEMTIEDAHKILVSIEHDIIEQISNAIVTIHPVPT